MKSSFNIKEAQFFALIKDWANPNGSMKPLHAYNKLRTWYIREMIMKDDLDVDLKLKKVLDVGCGGGLLSTSLSWLGLNVTGIDPNENCIKISSENMHESLKLNFKQAFVEDIQEKFDIVTSMEVIEHVDNQE